MRPLYSNQIDRYIYLAECDSTNNLALLNLSNNGPKENICIYTYNQSAGRGQIGRKWYSGSGKNLTCSFRIPLDAYPVSQQFYLNMAFALAVKDFIRRFISDEVSIKWPNDIYVGDKKIAGLLIQNTLRAEYISSTILGVGINVNETDFPSDLPNPVSLQQLVGIPQDLLTLQQLLAAIVMDKLERLLERAQDYRNEYLNALFRKGVPASYIVADTDVTGIIQGISESGKLEVAFNGRSRLFSFREIAYVI